MPAVDHLGPAWSMIARAGGLRASGGMSESLVATQRTAAAAGVPFCGWDGRPRRAELVCTHATWSASANGPGNCPGRVRVLGPGVFAALHLSHALGAVFQPARFLVSVHSLASLRELLKRARGRGFVVRAELGLDLSLDHPAVAWILIDGLPELEQRALEADPVLSLGVRGAAAAAENQGVQLDEDVSVVLPRTGYGALSAVEEWALLQRHVPDLPQLDGLSGRLHQVTEDWESALPGTLLESLSRSTALHAPDTLQLYRWVPRLLALWLAKAGGSPRGLRAMPYLLGDPAAALRLGILEVPYWQGTETAAAEALAAAGCQLPELPQEVVELVGAPQRVGPAVTVRRLHSLQRLRLGPGAPLGASLPRLAMADGVASARAAGLRVGVGGSAPSPTSG